MIQTTNVAVTNKLWEFCWCGIGLVDTKYRRNKRETDWKMAGKAEIEVLILFVKVTVLDHGDQV